MPTLYLMRHAKAADDLSAPTDHERPLAPRGRRAAGLVGEHMAKRKAPLDAALCSTATRATDTARLALDEWSPRTPLTRERGLYLCGWDGLLDRLRGVPDSVGALLLVAHNPDIHELAAFLTDERDTDKADAFVNAYPTGALTEFDIDRPWREIGAESGRLGEYVAPRFIA